MKPFPFLIPYTEEYTNLKNSVQTRQVVERIQRLDLWFEFEKLKSTKRTEEGQKRFEQLLKEFPIIETSKK